MRMRRADTPQPGRAVPRLRARAEAAEQGAHAARAEADRVRWTWLAWYAAAVRRPWWRRMPDPPAVPGVGMIEEKRDA